MAAVIGARLSQFVLTSLDQLHPRVIMWSDSQIALHWLLSTKKLPLFVVNRTQEIHSLVPHAMWNYCPTQDNPADLVTRGVSVQVLKESCFWQYGPAWLTEESQWPRWEHSEIIHLQTSLDDTEQPANTKDTPTYHTGIGEIIDIHCYSTLSRLLHTSAYVLRFVHNCKQSSPDQRLTGHLKPSEIEIAACSWIRHTQQTSFSIEFSTLKSKARSCRQSPLARQLQLFLNSKQIICCRGRIMM